MIFIAAAQAHAGPWPQEKGGGEIITSLLYDRADRAYDEDRQRVDEGWFRKSESSLYLEYGATERLTLLGRLAWQDVARRQGETLDSAQGLAASEIGARYLAWRDEFWVVSVQGAALIPGEGENVSDQPLGEGDLAWDARLLAGRSLGRSGFAEIQTGFRRRIDPFLDEARLDVSAGWRPGRYSVIAQSFSVWSVQTPSAGARSFDQHKLQLMLGRRFGEIEYHLGAYFTPTGRNTIDQRAVFLQVWRRF